MDDDKTDPESLDSTEVDPVRERGLPERVGPYRILERLGEGGMGVVYLAEQTEPVRRRVALKVIKHGMDTKRVVARFEAERQALAMMSHPCVAKVYDAGSTDGGRPYFAMEYVQGVPITEHCDRQRLTTRERLELFQQVCEGVQHAHQNAIIHRDLKPSNVLVSYQDDKATPKIIDFGVAKAIRHRLTEKTVYTEMGVLIGTPEYMSPEQAEMTGQNVDTRTDVYSLGVMLYELLVGTLPFESKELRQAGFDEIRRKIREDRPSTPSRRVSTLGGGRSTESAECRGTDLPTLRSQLKGDLDWITMRALEKDRARRYGSPSELAADLERHLTSQAVLASPPSATYRARKFVRRHRWGVGAAAVAVLALVAFAGTMAVQANRISAERDRANAEAEAKGQVAEFMVQLFEIPDPGEARGRTITVAEMLDKSSERIERGLKDEPVIRARLMATLGKTYSHLGLFGPAQRLLEQSLAIRVEHLPSDHPETATNLYNLGVLTFRQGCEGALDLLNRSLVMRGKVLGPDDPELAWTMDLVAAVHRNCGDREQFKDYVKEADDVWDRIGEDPDSTDWRLAFHHVHRAYAQDSPEDALPFLLKAMEVFERIEEEDTYWPVVVETPVDRLARFYLHGLKDYQRALPLFQRDLERARKFYGPEHVIAATNMVSFARCLRGLGRYDEALPMTERALIVLEKRFGPKNSETAHALRELSTLLLVTGETEKARPLYRRAMEIWNSDGHDTFLGPTVELADLVRDAGEHDDALRLYEIVIDHVESNPGGFIYGVPHRAHLKAALNRSAELLREIGRDAEAAEHEASAAELDAKAAVEADP